MKKFFVLLFGLIILILIVGCQNLENILPSPNKAPVIISEPIITAKKDQLYSYQIEASDPDGDNLNYFLIIKPEGMSIHTEKNGLITWIPTNSQVGIHQVIVEVSDGKYKVQQNFEIKVFNLNNPPQIFSYFPANLNSEINEGNSVKFEIQAHDIDLNTSLSYQWLLNGKKISSSTVSGNNSKSSWIYSSGYGDYSQKIVKVIVSDGELEDYMQWNITIKDITPPTQPTLNSITSPTNISPQILSGTKDVDSSILINGAEIISINSSVNWSYSYNLSEGTNNISITSRDVTGNESASITTTVILDTSAPGAPTLDAVVSLTNITPQVLSGSKEANSSIWINGTEVISINSDIAWSYTFDLFEGNNKISIISHDVSGNESAAVTTDIVLDTIAPEAPTLNAITSPTNISTQTLSGTKDTNTSIWLNGVEVVPLDSSTTDWSYPYNLTEGTNNISITSCDAAGNESPAVLTIIEYDPNIYVDAGNTTGTEDGTKTHPFNTITEGLIAVASAKSVMVAVGAYNEKLIINKSITLQGASRDNTFITGSGLTGNLITIEADYVTITGFTIHGASSAAKGIYFDNCSFININNNIIQNNISYGINYRNSSPTIENNIIKNNNYSGIDIAAGGGGIVRNNSLIFNQHGIRTYGDSCPEINGNNISNNNTGIFCRESATPIISYNTISNNTGYGILIDNAFGNSVNPDTGGGAGQSDGQNKITGNSIHGVSNKTTHNIYAKYNWWGASTGPKYPGNNSSSGDWVYWSETGGDIIFTPHLTTGL